MASASSFEGSLLHPLFGCEVMRAQFGARARVQAMLDFEAALARAEARVGVIPRAAVPAIEGACRVEHYDLAGLAAAAAEAGNPAIPLVKALTARVSAERDGESAARYVHWGATSQDVIDSALVLQLRGALLALDAQLARLCAALEARALRDRATVMAGRTFLQHAVPVTFGLKAAAALSAAARERERLRALRERALCLQFGGAAGTLSALGERGLEVAEALADELGLALPDLPWHSQRDRIAELGAALGLCCGTLGKLARDLSLLMQSELAEAREPAAPGRGGSSTMPHKHNPVGCTVALAAAVRAPGLVATLLAAMVQEHERGLGGWHAEWETLPSLFELTAGSARAMIAVVEGLQVDARRMRENLELSGGEIYAEAVTMALADKLGKRAAHDAVEACSREARARGESLRDALRAHPSLRAELAREALDALLSPERTLGMNDAFIERARMRARAPFITHEGARLHYRVDGPACVEGPDPSAGRAAPWLVLCHALGTDLSLWEAQMPALTRGFRVLRYDLRGHGRSEATAGEYALADLGGDLLSLLDALAIPRAHVCGISIGGLIAMWLAIRAPARVERLVLCDTAARIGTRASWSERIALVAREGLAPLAEPALARWFSDDFRAREPALMASFRARVLATSRAGYLGCCAALRDADLEPELAKICAPTLAIAGRHDPVTTVAHARALAAQIPGARCLELDGAHLANVEAGAAFSAGLLDFLEGGEDG